MTVWVGIKCDELGPYLTTCVQIISRQSLGLTALALHSHTFAFVRHKAADELFLRTYVRASAEHRMKNYIRKIISYYLT